MTDSQRQAGEGDPEREPSGGLTLATLPWGELRALQIDREIWVLAEELADGADGPGIERSRLEEIVRGVIYADRLARVKTPAA